MIVNVKKMWSGREGRDEQDRRTLTDGWSVLADDLMEPQFSVLRAGSLPRRFDPHNIYPEFYCDGVFIAEQKGPLFIVKAPFVVPTGSNGEDTPWTQPTDISGGTASIVEPTDVAYSPTNLASAALDTPIWNSATQSFDPAVGVEKCDMEFVFERNDQTIDYNLLRAYAGAVNSDTFFGHAAGLCKMADIRFQRLRFGGDFYYKKRYTVRAREPLPQVDQALGGVGGGAGTLTIGGAIRAWWRRIRDDGLNIQVTSSSDPSQRWRAILDVDGNQVSQPVPLDGNGQVRPPSLPPIWLEFRTQLHKPYAALGII